MRGLIVFCVLLLVSCVILRVEGDCNLNGENVGVGAHSRNCISYTCHESGDISAVTCPEYRCENPKGYKENDPTKPYPECCGGPICD